jgi:hypothetical protein
VSVAGADEDDAFQHERGGLDCAFRLEAPELLSGGEIDRVNNTGIVAEIDSAARDRGCAFDGFAGGEGPEQLGLFRRRGLRDALQLRTASMHRPVRYGRGEGEQDRGQHCSAARSSFRRDAETSTRDECAPQKSAA